MEISIMASLTTGNTMALLRLGTKMETGIAVIFKTELSLAKV